MYAFSLVYISLFSAPFGSAVDKRTKNNQILLVYVYVVAYLARLARQWIKERRINNICVKSKVSISSGSFGAKEQTSQHTISCSFANESFR